MKSDKTKIEWMPGVCGCICHCGKDCIMDKQKVHFQTCEHCKSQETSGWEEKDSYLKELYFNAKYGGKENTQLFAWTEEVWLEAVKQYISQERLKERKEIIKRIEFRMCEYDKGMLADLYQNEYLVISKSDFDKLKGSEEE